MLAGMAALFTMLFIAWLILQALSGRFPRLHVVMYLLTALTGIYTLAYFLSLGINPLIKITVALTGGLILVVFGTLVARRRRTR